MPPVSYIVASTPRTGSTLLCEALAATGVAGAPVEPFGRAFRGEWCRRWGLSEKVPISVYVAEALSRCRSSNGAAAFKIHWMDVPALADELEAPLDDVLFRLLPGARFVNVVRGDRRGQALSWFRALRTGEWHRLAGERPPQAPELDAALVLDLETEIVRQQAQWGAYFARAGVDALVVEYERLEQDLRREVERVLAFADLDPAAARSIPAPRLVRLADAATESWRRRLEAGGGGECRVGAEADDTPRTRPRLTPL